MRSYVVWLGLPIAVLLALPASAQVANRAQPPARIDNVYNGRHHEPNPAAVRSNERAAGVALTPGQQSDQNRTVEQEASKLIDKTRRETGGMAHSTAP